MSPSPSQTLHTAAQQSDSQDNRPTLPSPILPSASIAHRSSPTAVPRPPFAPFFTLVSSGSTKTISHPRDIHYIFSDDEPDLLTSACVAALSPSHNKDDRVLLVDLADNGTSVVSAKSLSPAWQIVKTTLTPAPTWNAGNEVDREVGAVPELMLTIEGTDGSDGLDMARMDAAVHDGNFEALMEDFDRRMAVLREIVTENENVPDKAAGGNSVKRHPDVLAEEDWEGTG